MTSKSMVSYQQDGLSFFVSTIKPANITYSYMNIPFKFSAFNGFRKKREIMVRDPVGREWQLKISGSGNNWHFHGGGSILLEIRA
ncbi:hypothetical protein QJS04_geneDACA025017 [Acorus gramineus]|uniref:Uncharacterized protein n=1 Tax=Acorus gramineus TaxID=55184 RepID=A0AAV9A6G1_ACOGR|nr:hypothetical protein QJS04_geneDACA025017 [Acorus gramineus]